ncbi:GPI inositol-deacylase PGAP1-like [Trypanosoma melophagium]|uniref:GPI inositol-deacylase PGAP1-like n=1 Tax=Trypanosoma melophagium TaxID=715481 RepID=UPI00351A7B22|nr:GPI inositol-deacylase PGAP1-like [Trypanosoma melophagium]
MFTRFPFNREKWVEEEEEETYINHDNNNYNYNYSFGMSVYKKRNSIVIMRVREIIKVSTWATFILALLFALSIMLFLLTTFKAQKQCNDGNPLSNTNEWYVLGYEEIDSTRVKMKKDTGTGYMNESYRLHRLLCYSPKLSLESILNTLDVLVFFIHGNAGSYKQGGKIGCLLKRRRNVIREVYSFDFAEQANIHRGRVLWQQANFVVNTLKTLRSKENSIQKAEQKYNKSTPFIWLIGHSMGGVVAGLALEMIKLEAKEMIPLFHGIIMLNSPYLQPPIFLDEQMLRLYLFLWQSVNKSYTIMHLNNVLPRIVSISSGALDLQVEQQLTFLPSRDTGKNPKIYFNIRTDKPNVCGKTLSHNDIIRDYCVGEFVASFIVNASKEEKWEREDNTNLVPVTHTSVLSRWGEWSVINHTLPVAVVSLYTALLLSAIIPLIPHLIYFFRFFTHIMYLRVIFHFCFGSQLLLIFTAPLIGSGVLMTFFIGIMSRLIIQQLNCCLFNFGGDWCLLPWVTDSLMCTPTKSLGHIIFTAIGPLLIGSWAGVTAYHLLGLLFWLIRSGLKMLWSYFSRYSLLRCFRRTFSTHFSNYHYYYYYYYYFPLIIYTTTFVLCELFSLKISRRALVWLFFLLILFPTVYTFKKESKNKFQYHSLVNCQLLVLTYALLHVLHLQPFFVLRNAWKSGTNDNDDDVTVIDGYSRVVEIFLHILILIHILWPIHFSLEQQKRLKYFLCSRYLELLMIVFILASCLLLVISIVAMNAIPVESFRIVWVLVLGFPALLFCNVAVYFMTSTHTPSAFNPIVAMDDASIV